jgi:hypothetical protein
MGELKKYTDLLAEIASGTIRSSTENGDLLERARRLTEIFILSPDEIRSAIMQSVSSVAGNKLRGLSSLAAERAMNTRDDDWIRVGIVAHILEGFRFDPRENIRELVLIYHASKRIGVEFEDLCRALLRLAEGDAQFRLQEFCSRDSELNQLGCVGIKEIRIGDQIRFVPI